MSLSTWLGLGSWHSIALPVLAQIAPEVKPAPSKQVSTSAYEKAKRRCALFQSKPVATSFCLSEAKRWLKNPSPPPKPRSAFEKEMASCRTMGKGPVIAECQRRARKRVDSQGEPTVKSEPISPLKRQLNNCRVLSKGAAIDQCQREVRKRFR